LFGGGFGAQPQGDVGWLHGLRDHPEQLVVEAPRSISSRRRAEKDSSVFLASYLLL
jgi:hypothetical protein